MRCCGYVLQKVVLELSLRQLAICAQLFVVTVNLDLILEPWQHDLQKVAQHKAGDKDGAKLARAAKG